MAILVSSVNFLILFYLTVCVTLPKCTTRTGPKKYHFTRYENFLLPSLRALSQRTPICLLWFQDFLAGSASNVGAWELKRCADAVIQTINQSSTRNLPILIARMKDAFRDCSSDIAMIRRKCGTLQHAFLTEACCCHSSTVCDCHEQHEQNSKQHEQTCENDESQALISRTAAVFQHLHARLRRLRERNRCGDVRAVREEAAAIAAAAAAMAAAECSSHSLSVWAARVAEATLHVPLGDLDELELRLDTAEALWLSGIRVRA
jgi:hypothetical protein